MRRTLITALAVSALLAAAAAAGTLPNAADEHVMRFGPLASAVIDVHDSYEERGTIWGGGVALWGQYDRTWIGYAMRLGAAVVDADGSLVSIGWESEYYIYLAKGRLRPFIMPHVGVGVNIRGKSGGASTAPLGIYAGARWNGANSPFYITVSAGFKSGGRWGASFRSDCYLGLTDTVALYAGAELDRANSELTKWGRVPGWRGRVDVGPSWAF